jgi:hypothetical protein
MKIRNGFVSNSSSSSFCIYGAEFDYDEIIELCIENKLIEENFDYSEEGIEVALEAICKKIGLSYETGSYEDTRCWIGRDWQYIGDNETGKQFKDCIKNKLSWFFKKDVKVCTYEETYYS